MWSMVIRWRKRGRHDLLHGRASPTVVAVGRLRSSRGGENKTMTRWMHPPELERQREFAHFDPVIEGARSGLSREVALVIWERVCADATDSKGRRNTEQSERRFQKIAARIAARGGRRQPDVGRLTRVETEVQGVPPGTWALDELTPSTPGRTTLVATEMRRWRAYDHGLSTPLENAGEEMS